MPIRIFPIVIFLIVAVGVVVTSAFVYHIMTMPSAEAQSNPTGVIWKSGGNAGLTLYKIQDGVCSIYIVGDNVRMAIATGPGCK